MQKKKVLFIGHDFKFLTHVIDFLSKSDQYVVSLFHYQGHVIKDFDKLIQESKKSDILFCEWGLGNLSWLSKNSFPDQKIIVRIHAQEFFTTYLNETRWKAVDKVILVGPHKMNTFNSEFPSEKHKTQVIFNSIDTASFDLQKESEARFNIGMLGILPKLKAPHLALDILVELKKHDKRYRLFIKGRRPEELTWLWRKPEEREYYDRFYNTINEMGLADSVVFEAYDDKVSQWLQSIGFILSPSEHESFHMAIVEGMASGAIPVIRNWQGSDLLYPKKYIFESIKGAVEIICNYADSQKIFKEEKQLKEFATKNFDKKIILKQFDKIFSELSIELEAEKTDPFLRGIINREAVVIEQKIESTLQNLEKYKLQIIEKNKQIHGLNQLETEIEQQLINRNQKIDGLKKQKTQNEKQLVDQKQQVEDLKKTVEEYEQQLINSNRFIKNLNLLNTDKELKIKKQKKQIINQTEVINEKEIINNKHEHYIQYLEKRFFNKVIGIIRKRLR